MVDLLNGLIICYPILLIMNTFPLKIISKIFKIHGIICLHYRNSEVLKTEAQLFFQSTCNKKKDAESNIFNDECAKLNERSYVL